MKEKDIACKKLFSSKEIFADFINTTICGGKHVVDPRKNGRIRK